MITERDLLRYTTHAGALAFFGKQKSEATIERWMTPRERMLSVALSDTTEHAASLLRQGIWRHIPVLDYWGRLHSILDVRDVMLQCFGDEGGLTWQGRSVSDVLAAKRRYRLASATTPGGDAPASAAHWQDALAAYLLENASRHTCSVRTTVERAAEQILQERLTFLVVVDHDAGGERVAGLVTERSFLPFCAAFEEDADAARPLSSATAGPAVSTLMTPIDQTLHISLTAPALDCVDIFLRHNVRHLPVVDGEKLLGIISMRDVLRPLLP